MDTGLYYTFSTIAQTLAGAYAIVGAFLLFHLTRVGDRLNEHLKDMKSRYDVNATTQDLQQLWSGDDLAGLLEYFATDRLGRLTPDDRSLWLEPARALFEHRRELLADLEPLSAITISTMIGSFLMLALTPSIMQLGWDYRAAVFVLSCSVGISCAGYCLTQYGRLVRRLVSWRA